MPIEILMPALSPTMESGTLSSWQVKVGDTVSSGDLLAEIETDKATMEVEAVDEGKIGKILVEAGTENVAVNAPIAILLEEGEDESALDGYEPGGAAAPKAESKDEAPKAEDKPKADDKPETKSDAPKSAPSGGGKDGDRIFASPLAKRIAEQKGLDLSAVKGSGPNGRIIKRDVENLEKSAQAPKEAPKSDAAPASDSKEVGMPKGDAGEYFEKMGIPSGSYDLIPLDGMRKTVAKRLTASFRDIPHFPLNVDCELDALLKLRKELNERAPDGVKISVNDMLIRASALALKAVPEANASFSDHGIAQHHHADVAVAVAIDGGLITPIIREAENKGLATISAEMKDLASRARDRKLKPQEYQGGTFSISNLGMFGIKSFGSIINEPQGMILSVGAGEKRPVVKDDALAMATVMTVTLSCDHRVVDGAIGAQWLKVFKGLVEDPVTMML